MNTRTLIALATLAFTGAAFAQEATSDEWMNVVSSKSRSQVLAELAQAQADGSIAATRDGYLEVLASRRTRAEVRRETLAALRNGEYARLNAEAHDFGDTPALGRIYLAQTLH